MNCPKIIIKIIKNGQPKPYADSEYEYELTVDKVSEQDVFKYCTETLEPCNQTKDQWNIHEASSYFQGYYSFTKIGDNKYRYYKFRPYCD